MEKILEYSSIPNDTICWKQPQFLENTKYQSRNYTQNLNNQYIWEPSRNPRSCRYNKDYSRKYSCCTNSSQLLKKCLQFP